MTTMLKRNFLAKAINPSVRFISSTKKGNYAFAFDIDGVLIKVNSPLSFSLFLNNLLLLHLHRENVVFQKQQGRTQKKKKEI
jgi:hypothetical protein